MDSISFQVVADKKGPNLSLLSGSKIESVGVRDTFGFSTLSGGQ